MYHFENDKLVYGVLAGCIPGFLMLLSSVVMAQIVVPEYIEASLQNFSAGLIIGAVAGELFPLLSGMDEGVRLVGITIGFILSLGMLFGVEFLIGYYSEVPSSSSGSNDEMRSQKSEDGEISQVSDHPYYQANAVWEEESLRLATASYSNPEHRSNITSQFKDMITLLKSIEKRASVLSSDKDLTTEEIDEIAETIDRDILETHFHLNKSKRLFESDKVKSLNAAAVLTRITEDKKGLILERVKDLKHVVRHIIEHLKSTSLDGATAAEIHDHIEDVRHKLTSFREDVVASFTKWKRRLPRVPTTLGSVIPLSKRRKCMISPFFCKFDIFLFRTCHFASAHTSLLWRSLEFVISHDCI